MRLDPGKLNPGKLSPGRIDPGRLIPGEAALKRERAAFLATVESLPPEEFESGPTLCAGWTPRDVLAHVIGTDSTMEYVRTFGNIGAANEMIIRRSRRLTRAQLLTEGHRWAAAPSLRSRLYAIGMLGDVGVHHQDVLRGLARSREVPPAVARAILREGCLLGGTRLLTHRVEPTDGMGRAIGRGHVLRGTTEALGLWLCGRRSVESELERVG